MPYPVQVNISMPPAVRDRLDVMAAELGLSRSAFMRRALGFMQTADEARAKGYHVGIARDRAALELVIVPPL
jgi:predicted transcriptional regulator